LSLATQNRPRIYDDVLGQEDTIAVLKQLVREGKGFQQSYVFCGKHGSGKTTLARIFSQSLLCAEPVDGEACNKCFSCQAMLKEGAPHETFEELDAASKSKKEDLARIVEDIKYSTFSGQRRIYLFDESHQLSRNALDALLKPMEDDIEGTQDKQLVALFCTTEPGKMRTTIFSRCAPAFVIQEVPAENIADRLSTICEKEGIVYEEEALLAIAEATELHIRDAIMAVEGVSMLGSLTVGNVSRYLQLSSNSLAIDILEAIGVDLQLAVEKATEMAALVSPTSAYERLSEGSMLAYRRHLGVGKTPSYWDRPRIEELAKRGPAILGFSSRFAAPPYRPTKHTLILDVGLLHQAMIAGVEVSEFSKVVLGVGGISQKAPSPQGTPDSVGEYQADKNENVKSLGGASPNESPVARTTEGVWIDPRGVGNGASTNEGHDSSLSNETPSSVQSKNSGLSPQVFKELLQHHTATLRKV